MRSAYIFDAGPLITTCKFEAAGELVLDHLLKVCNIVIASSVNDEVVVAGTRYPDAQAAQRRLDSGQITVLDPPVVPDLSELLTPYGLGQGEHDSILLTRHSRLEQAHLVLDDHLAYLVSDRLTRRQHFLLDVIVSFVASGKLEKNLGIDIVKVIQSRYPPAFVMHTLIVLKRIRGE